MAVDSIMTRFAKEDVPVIHLVQIEKLATCYGLPVQPKNMPIVGEGKVFYREEYNKWLAAYNPSSFSSDTSGGQKNRIRGAWPRSQPTPRLT